ncbi:hypothetical protein PV325_007743 [Microctonus aethiopoides]|nr:hypothetical protein PV325_007743 [Microctonus aethiopoides]
MVNKLLLGFGIWVRVRAGQYDVECWLADVKISQRKCQSLQGPVRCTNIEESHEDIDLEPLDRGPYFVIAASQNVTALVGKSAILKCRVRNLGDRTWNLEFRMVCEEEPKLLL